MDSLIIIGGGADFVNPLQSVMIFVISFSATMPLNLI